MSWFKIFLKIGFHVWQVNTICSRRVFDVSVGKGFMARLILIKYFVLIFFL